MQKKRYKNTVLDKFQSLATSKYDQNIDDNLKKITKGNMFLSEGGVNADVNNAGRFTRIENNIVKLNDNIIKINKNLSKTHKNTVAIRQIATVNAINIAKLAKSMDENFTDLNLRLNDVQDSFGGGGGSGGGLLGGALKVAGGVALHESLKRLLPLALGKIVSKSPQLLLGAAAGYTGYRFIKETSGTDKDTGLRDYKNNNGGINPAFKNKYNREKQQDNYLRGGASRYGPSSGLSDAKALGDSNSKDPFLREQARERNKALGFSKLPTSQVLSKEISKEVVSKILPDKKEITILKEAVAASAGASLFKNDFEKNEFKDDVQKGIIAKIVKMLGLGSGAAASKPKDPLSYSSSYNASRAHLFPPGLGNSARPRDDGGSIPFGRDSGRIGDGRGGGSLNRAMPDPINFTKSSMSFGGPVNKFSGPVNTSKDNISQLPSAKEGPANLKGAPGGFKGDYTGGSGRIDRSQFEKELEDPATMAAFAGRMRTEVGSQGRNAQIAWAESTFNRAAARKQTLLQTVSGGDGYFGSSPPSNSDNPQFHDIIRHVQKSGSNISKGATGNSSGTVGFGQGSARQDPATGKLHAPGQTYEAGGERFGIEASDRKWKPKYLPDEDNKYKIDNKKGIPKGVMEDSLSFKESSFKKNEYVSPVTGTHLKGPNSGFGANRDGGRLHAGNDWAAANGSDVTAMADGEVVHARHQSGYGYMIDVKMKNGDVIRYATHGPTMGWKVGDKVSQGEKIGEVGSGHLHQEVIPGDYYDAEKKRVGKDEFVSTSSYGQFKSIDPQKYFGITNKGTNVTGGQPFAPSSSSAINTDNVTNLKTRANDPGYNAFLGAALGSKPPTNGFKIPEQFQNAGRLAFNKPQFEDFFKPKYSSSPTDIKLRSLEEHETNQNKLASGELTVGRKDKLNKVIDNLGGGNAITAILAKNRIAAYNKSVGNRENIFGGIRDVTKMSDPYAGIDPNVIPDKKAESPIPKEILAGNNEFMKQIKGYSDSTNTNLENLKSYDPNNKGNVLYGENLKNRNQTGSVLYDASIKDQTESARSNAIAAGSVVTNIFNQTEDTKNESAKKDNVVSDKTLSGGAGPSLSKMFKDHFDKDDEDKTHDGGWH